MTVTANGHPLRPHSYRKALLFFLCGAFVVLWSSGFVGAKYGLDHAGTFTLLFWRYLLVVAVLSLLVTLMRQWRPLSRAELTRHAVVGALAHAGWLAAVLGAIDLGLSAGLAAFITALQPIMTGALSARMTGERVGMREWAGLMLGVGAVAFVIGDGIALGGSLAAYALPFLAVAAITIASLVDRAAHVASDAQAAKPATPLLFVTFIHALASLAVLAPLAVGLEGLEAQWGGELVFAIVWLGLVVSLAAYGLMFALLRRLPAARVASLTYLSPPVTMVIAWFVFRESLTPTAAVGLVIAAMAVALTLSGRRAVAAEVDDAESPPVEDIVPVAGARTSPA
jgi:drug/metabolite transporter (DMT)-like permease